MKILRLFIFSAVITSSMLSYADALKDAKKAIPNFHIVDAGVYRGGRPEDDGLAALQQLGVKNIVDLQGGDLKDTELGWAASIMEPGENPDVIAHEKRVVTKLGMNFIHLPLNSLDEIPVSKGGKIAVLLKFMGNPQNQPIFIHCEHGADRTGMIIALYRVYFDHWTRKAAHNEMVKDGHTDVSGLFTGDLDDFFWAATEGMP